MKDSGVSVAKALAADARTTDTRCVQYTSRRIPKPVADAIRERARATGKSLNDALVEILADGARVKRIATNRRDLSDIAGTWNTDHTLDSALADQGRVDGD